MNPFSWKPAWRSLVIGIRLLPFAASLARDHNRFIVLGSPRPISEAQKLGRAQKLTSRIASLGPTFIKLAQVLAMREDLIPKLYADQFKQLQDRVPPFSYEEVRQTIKAELGLDLESVFEDFEKTPIAAASLGQVHRARRSGELVAVKVLRPGVEALVKTDLRVTRRLLLTIRVLLGSSGWLRNLRSIVNEFERVICEEMDFEHEARNVELFRENLSHLPHVIVPELYPGACSRRVLTLKFYDGVRVDDTEALRQFEIDPMELLATLVNLYTRMIVVDGLLHVDPHPGNLLVNRAGDVIVLDYGMVIRLDPDTKMELLKAAIAVVRGDADGLVNGFYKLNMVEPGTNLVSLRDAAKVLLNINYTTGYSPRRIQQICEEILRTFYTFPVRLPSGLVYLLRTSALIEGIGISFDPKFNGVRFATPIIRKVVKEVHTEPQRGPFDKVLDQVLRVGQFFGSFEDVVFRLEREELRIRVHPSDLGEIERYFLNLQKRIVVGMSAVAIAMVTAIVFLATHNNKTLIIGETIALILFIILMILPGRQQQD